MQLTLLLFDFKFRKCDKEIFTVIIRIPDWFGIWMIECGIQVTLQCGIQMIEKQSSEYWLLCILTSFWVLRAPKT